MELKLETHFSLWRHEKCSNRTFMELKSSKMSFSEISEICSNRTFMELKCFSCEAREAYMVVLIVPLWN